MNDKDWDTNEFWDDEVHADDDEDDDDDFGGAGSDVDANNDETFHNAAEWNEDEHEEMIARDSILSHTKRTTNNNHASNNNHSVNNIRAVTGATSTSTNNTNNNMVDNTFSDILNNRNNYSNNGTELNHNALVANILGNASTSGWDSAAERPMFPLLNETQSQVQAKQQQQQHQPNLPKTFALAALQNSLNPTDHLKILQAHQQQQLLLQSRSHEQEQIRQQQQQLRERQALQQHQQQLNQQQQQQHLREQQLRSQQPIHQSMPVGQMDTGRRILRVDELESQLRKTNINQGTPTQALPAGMPGTSKRAGWSPFGGKDLFTATDPNIHALLASQMGDDFPIQLSMDLERQQRLILEQQQILQYQQQQISQAISMKQMALQRQQQQQQQLLQQEQRLQQNQLESRLIPPNTKCFTVEELERQMMAGTKSESLQPETEVKRINLIRREQQQQHQNSTEQPNETYKLNDKQRHQTNNNNQDRRNGERFDRYEKQHQHQQQQQHHHRDMTDSHRDHRDNRREHRNNRDHRHHKKVPVIIPPQVQLSVIDKAKRLHSISTMHSDEFIQDRMPTTSDGFRFKKHSQVANEKPNHDGVLTEKERNWLTKIQEKIQADYDDNLDQDYYYLLYFNRSSMTNEEAAQKPCGPGVSDRRFIPRERLLYNNSINLIDNK